MLTKVDLRGQSDKQHQKMKKEKPKVTPEVNAKKALHNAEKLDKKLLDTKNLVYTLTTNDTGIQARTFDDVTKELKNIDF